MKEENDYLAINRNSWNNRVATHLKSEFYNQEAFLHGKSSLNSIELGLLGDISGKKILHLQCHFGQDSISLGKLGAEVTGIDLSDTAIKVAQQVAEQMQSTVTFIACNLYDLPNHLEGEFDLVFTSYGTIGWLPDLEKWANIISKYLKPKGRFVFVEFHPVVWMFDDEFDKIGYRYFNSGAIVEDESGTYANKSADIQQKNVTWNHSLSEVVQSLIRSGLTIRSFEEYDYSPYDCFHKTIEVNPGQFRIEHLHDFIPMLYSIVAEK